MKRIGYISCLAVLLFATQGCSLTGGALRTVATLAGNVQVPPELIDQGPDAVKAYVVARYPAAAPYVDAVLGQFFPGKPAPVGPPQFVQVPITYSTNVTFILTEEIGGVKSLDGSKVSAVHIKKSSKAGKPVLPESETVTLTVAEFISSGLTPVVTPVEPDEPADPDDPGAPMPVDPDDLPANPDIPLE